MMRIIRVFNITKRNPCIFQNVMQGYKAPAQKAIRMSISTDALNERLKEENINEHKKVETHDEDMICTPHYNNKKTNSVNSGFSKEFVQSLLQQDKQALIKILGEMTSSNTTMFMKSLYFNRVRSIEVLNILSKRLQHSPPTSLCECSSILYYAAVLNFRDLDLIKALCKNIIALKTDFDSYKLPVNIMKTLGVLKYNDKEILEVLVSTILHYKKELSVPDALSTTLTSLALVNSDTPYAKALIKILNDYSETDFTKLESYLNFVWSCVILNELNPKLISKVLSTEFSSKVLGNDKHRNNLLKLHNIHGAALCILQSYSGPLLQEYNLSVFDVKKSKLKFLEAIKNTIYYICPKDGFVKFNVDTEAGFSIDAVCNLNSEGEIVRVKNNDGTQKVGMVLLDFHDFCLGSDKLTGITAFKVRLLQAKGYKPLLIPHTEFSLSSKLSTKIDYLRNKFRSIV